MKKLNLFALIAMLFSVTLFIACSSDDDDDETKDSDDVATLIVGKWKFVESNHPEEFEPCDYEGWTQFKEGGAYVEYDKCINQTINGTWKIDNEGKLIYNQSNVSFTFKITIKELTKDKLVLEETILGHTSILTYKRIE
ncbi:lipocalin family protein [Bacteroides finegoldii]|jgi:hypothetical protein|uniref:lipocalin family protein n=1 Tax=Bacteroides finegoldii TaxID=338188 RepID=UPI00189F36EE|nr:lipocalin family protein [Bacteroides finegoldii]